MSKKSQDFTVRILPSLEGIKVYEKLKGNKG
jgi:hypothetical protein